MIGRIFRQLVVFQRTVKRNLQWNLRQPNLAVTARCQMNCLPYGGGRHTVRTRHGSVSYPQPTTMILTIKLFQRVGIVMTMAFGMGARPDGTLAAKATPTPAAQPAAKSSTAGLNYGLQFATYFGGAGGELLRDMTMDDKGDIYGVLDSLPRARRSCRLRGSRTPIRPSMAATRGSGRCLTMENSPPVGATVTAGWRSSSRSSETTGIDQSVKSRNRSRASISVAL